MNEGRLAQFNSTNLFGIFKRRDVRICNKSIVRTDGIHLRQANATRENQEHTSKISHSAIKDINQLFMSRALVQIILIHFLRDHQISMNYLRHHYYNHL